MLRESAGLANRRYGVRCPETPPFSKMMIIALLGILIALTALCVSVIAVVIGKMTYDRKRRGRNPWKLEPISHTSV